LARIEERLQFIHSNRACAVLPPASAPGTFHPAAAHPRTPQWRGRKMLRGAGQKQHPSVHAAPSGAGRGTRSVSQGPYLRRRQAVLERRTGIAKVAGFCGWALAGGTAFFAIWELGNFSVLIGNSPLLPAAVREAPPAGAFRPAGGPQETDSGCTQAPIDRSSGQTTPADCHTSVPGHETMTALLTGRRFAR